MKKKPKRKAVRVKPVKPAVIKPEVVKVVLVPDKVLHVEAPRDHVPIVAVHPSKSVVTVAAVPRKKRTVMQWLFGE